MSISEDDHEKLDVGSKEIIEENTSKDSIREKEREKENKAIKNNFLYFLIIFYFLSYSSYT